MVSERLITKQRIPIMISDDIDDQPIDYLIERLQEIKRNYQDKYKNIKIETETFDCDIIEIYFYGEVVETDEEYNTRITVQKEQEKRRLKIKEGSDKKEFERMKKQYGW